MTALLFALESRHGMRAAAAEDAEIRSSRSDHHMRPERRPSARDIRPPPLPPHPRPRRPHLPRLSPRRPLIRRRFRELHSAPLLGLFLDIFDSDTPAFRPLRLHSDPDIAAAVRGGDFLLTRLPVEFEGVAPEWVIQGCDDGYVILISYNTEHMAVYNPITRALDLFPKPPGEICEEMCVEYHVLSSQEDHRPFRVMCVCHEAWGAQAAVLSSDFREWQIFPWVDAATMKPDRVLLPGDTNWLSGNGTLVNGTIYWTDASPDSARVLDISTLHFSRIDLPPHIEGQGALRAGEAKDGKLCIITTVKLTLIVWFWRTDNDGVERWMLDKTFPLEQAIHALDHCFDRDHIALKILAVVNGVVYLSAYCGTDCDLTGSFLSFCLETESLNKLCTILRPYSLYPYIMAWPPSLVFNKPTSSS